MEFILQILALAALLAGIAPVAMAGGQMIAAFMMGKHILPWLVITLGTMIALVVGAVFALQVLWPMFGTTWGAFSAIAMVLPPWGVHWAGKRWMEGKVKA